jgi:hypothetical protein
MYLVDLLQANVAMMVLVIVGGLLYTGGAVCYALKKPNPWPGHFGFHEIFHVCTVLAFLCHWTACLLIALTRRALARRVRRRDVSLGAPSRGSATGAVLAGIDVLIVDVGRAGRGLRLGLRLGIQLLVDVGAVPGASDAPQHVDDEEHDDDGDERDRDEPDEPGRDRVGVDGHRG